MSSRRSGRTLAMVRKLKAGDAYVVHSATMRHYVQRMIGDLIDPALAKTVRVVIVRNRTDIAQLEGWRGRIRIDHSAQESINWQVLQQLVNVVAGCNAQHERVER